MKTKLLKGVGLLFALAIMIANITPLKAQAATKNAASLQKKDVLIPGDILTYDGTIEIWDYDGGVLLDSGEGSIVIKDSYLSNYGRNTMLIDTIAVVNETTSYLGTKVIQFEMNGAYASTNCAHSWVCENPDEYGHDLKCTLCGETHTMGHNFENKHYNAQYDYYTYYGNCIRCGYYKCLHEWVLSPVQTDALKHDYVCTHCGASDYGFHYFENGMNGVCLECGLEITLVDGTPIVVPKSTETPNTSTTTTPVVPPVNDIVKFVSVFNSTDYANAYPDLVAVFGNDETLLFNHFLTCGMAEGRQGSAEFNVHVYRQNNPDLVTVFVDDLPAYYQHYINCGKAEGRISR